MFDDILRVEGDLSAASGAVDDELWDGIPGSVTAEALDDLDAFGHASAEVGGALDEIALIEIVGTNTAHEELLDEFLLDFDRVVDSFEKDGLVPHDKAGVCQATERVADFGGEFVGVVAVDGKEEGMELLEHIAEFRGDSLGKEKRDAGAKTKELNVGNLVETSEEAFEFRVGEEEWVSAGKKDITHLRGSSEILDGLVPLGFEFLVRNTGNNTGTSAVAAVGCAAVGDEKKNAIGVTVDESRNRHVGILATRVGHFRRVSVGFFNARDDLPADRAIGIGGVDEVEEVRRDGSGQFGPGEEDAGSFFFRECQVFLDVGE